MKRMTQILSLGLLLSLSTIALAGGGHDRNHRDGYYDGQYRHASNDVRYGKHLRKHSKHHRHGKRHYVKHHRHGKRHYVKHSRHAGRNSHRHSQRHSHRGRYCYDWHPRGYVAPRMHYGYSSPGVVIIYEPREGLFIGAGR